MATISSTETTEGPGIPIHNRSNRDTIDAGPGADRIEGGDQGDIIRAGPLQELDSDTVLGQHGIDTIDVANYPAFLDTVDCDGDQDWEDYAIADPLDSIAADCENVLRISERSSTRVKGYLQRPSTPYLEFDSYQESGLIAGVLEGGHPYDKETTSVITLDDDALPGDENRISIKLTVNPEAKTIKQRVTTPDSSQRKLSDEDRKAIKKAGEMVAEFLDRKGRGDCNMKNQETLVLRHFALLADTHKDHTFEDLEITHKGPENKCGSNQNAATTNPSATNLSARGGVPGITVAQVCSADAPGQVNHARTRLDRPAGPPALQGRYVPLQSEGGDDIEYLDCGSSDNTAYYDLSGGDPSSSYPMYGPGTSEELGTCGPSESGFLEFAYTQDCLDHDYCEDPDGGGGGFFDCVDEFFFAIDDTVYSAITSPYGDDCEAVVPSASEAGNSSVSLSPGARDPSSPTAGGPMLASKKA